ncbi:MAG: toxic anion resistance protein [Eubacteriales bacterium]|jgi:uncharacterized protein YaaN involved in tellurite resistance|nr:toxic anion resistance protein [Eubacteriales bacterium]MDD4104647.1 toxic anion resistance protein [Eubacteriales bacterium]MDD4710801.1 toxic anion resistance protein [Eubacteriales bacterium]NLO14412.1 hypothetical protein [Clostridiales bacterium]
MQKDIDQITADAALNNTRTLKENTDAILEETHKGTADADTVKSAGEDTQEALACALDVQQQARRKRAKAEKELRMLEQNARAILKPEQDADRQER